MATLHDRLGRVVLSLTPLRLSEGTASRWVDTLLVLATGGKRRLEDTVSLSIDDLEDLCQKLEALAVGKLEEFDWESEEELRFRAYLDRDKRIDALILECWHGDPFELMVGHRFIVEHKEFETVSSELKKAMKNLHQAR